VTAKDPFGTTIRPGQRVLRVGRHRSKAFYVPRIVNAVRDDELDVQLMDDDGTQLRWAKSSNLFVHPEDAMKGDPK
jgi:hypothetical protein